MQARVLERVLAGTEQIDLCHPCHAIWFDRAESMQLAPGAVIELFREVHQRRDGLRTPLAERLGCPRCRTTLVLTHDVAKTGRFSYYRCPQDHGRLTPFFEFLREKQFVRSLSNGELARVRAELKTVRCSGCGAPIDLERENRCGFCRSPIAILDADAVEKAVKMWSEADARRARPRPEDLAAALVDLRALETKARGDARRWRGADAAHGISAGGDLLDAAIGALGDALSAIHI
jgi:hypothetical protein